MAKGLEERDRVKETFNKFHNKEIAKKLLSGEVKLGGERREATIFFSDVRGFTGMSESMEPEQVVEMLNEYMTRMVSIVLKNNGTDCLISKSIHDKVKDKFIFETCASARVKGKTEAIEIFQLRGYYDEQKK